MRPRRGRRTTVNGRERLESEKNRQLFSKVTVGDVCAESRRKVKVHNFNSILKRKSANSTGQSVAQLRSMKTARPPVHNQRVGLGGCVEGASLWLRL